MTITNHQISKNDVHLWLAFTDRCRSPLLVHDYFEMLNENEKIMYERFHFDQDRHQYLVTRALLRTVLSSYENEIQPQQWKFSLGEYGKPAVCGNFPGRLLKFNISHTNKLVVLALTPDHEVGVDVENLDRKVSVLDISKRYFSPTEAKSLFSLPKETDQIYRFFQLWTLKEAYIKACGEALSIPLDQFSYSFPDMENISISFETERNDHPDNWKFWQINIKDEFILSIALCVNKDTENHSIKMRDIIPLDGFNEVCYPVTLKTKNNGWQESRSVVTKINPN